MRNGEPKRETLPERRQHYDIELAHTLGRLESRRFLWDMTDPYGGVFVWRCIA